MPRRACGAGDATSVRGRGRGRGRRRAAGDQAPLNGRPGLDIGEPALDVRVAGAAAVRSHGNAAMSAIEYRDDARYIDSDKHSFTTPWRRRTCS
ncbi:hypothetical protein PI86_08970 [Burkholderia sp. A9]|nr:hypothetical protein PI86_08970 [Burkholderia sp. A9]